MYYLSEEQWLTGIKNMNTDYTVIISTRELNHDQYRLFNKNEWEKKDWQLHPIRSAQPLKTFFYPPVQEVGRYPAKRPLLPIDKRVIIGPKACDIAALEIIDKIYLGQDYPDSHYLSFRKNTLIVSTDCLSPGEYCYCSLMNQQPYPKVHFDLNLSVVEHHYLLEIGTKNGKNILEKYFSGAQTAPDSLVLKREQMRERALEDVKQNNRDFVYYKSHQDSIEKHLRTDIWKELSKTCVECGICTQICPTCHCFLVYDVPFQNKYRRLRHWDSCFFAGYSRMAGGLTPRLALADRFKNRFYHKFDSFVINHGVEACTGCGRCVEGCMGKIDLREVLLELEKRVMLQENLDLQ
ncbi:MAG: 4Fe-4S dicluster domain-containing protein [Calditrichia bacterium]